jgi:hypothetical protein
VSSPRRSAPPEQPEQPENDWNTDALTGLIAPKEAPRRAPPPSSKPLIPSSRPQPPSARPLPAASSTETSSRPLPETRVRYLPPAALSAPASTVPLGVAPIDAAQKTPAAAAAPAAPSGARRAINVLGLIVGVGACLIIAKNAMVGRAPTGGAAASASAVASAIASSSTSGAAAGETAGKRPKRAAIETRAVPNPTAKDAANAFARGDYLEALAQYRALSRLDSSQAAYVSLIRVLEHRLAAKATPE